MGLERLDKLIAAQGMLSRREVKILASHGRITVGGAVVRDLSGKVDPRSSAICVDGVPLLVRERLVLMLNKPAGYVSSTDDGDGRTVLELIPEELRRRGMFPAGRLDKDTTGLMILTDDGQLAHRILAPRRHVKKKYVVTLDREPTVEMAMRFSEGIGLSEGVTKPAALEILDDRRALVVLTEGRYHQIKRMFSACGATVVALHRVAMGDLSLPDDLAVGQVRELTDAELHALQELAGNDEEV